MGYQVVLHERDDGKENRKNETRNLGLQSIINREVVLISDNNYCYIAEYDTNLNGPVPTGVVAKSV